MDGITKITISKGDYSHEVYHPKTESDIKELIRAFSKLIGELPMEKKETKSYRFTLDCWSTGIMGTIKEWTESVVLDFPIDRKPGEIFKEIVEQYNNKPQQYKSTSTYKKVIDMQEIR